MTAASPDTTGAAAMPTPDMKIAKPAAPAPAPAERTIYGPGGGRKLVFAFVFLLLLPFFASLPAMLYQRVAHGLWFDTTGLAIMAAGFTIIMVLVVFELIFALRSRLELGETSVRFTLPARGGAHLLAYTKKDIPYDQIAAVETRCELYGRSIAPVFMRGVQIVTKDGAKIPLGYVNESNVDPVFPFPTIAQQIAARAGVPVTDRGNVKRWMTKKIFGIKSSEQENTPVPETEIARLNTQHNRVTAAIVIVLLALLGFGIADDFWTGSIDRGERARDVVQETKQTAPKKK